MLGSLEGLNDARLGANDPYTILLRQNHSMRLGRLHHA